MPRSRTVYVLADCESRRVVDLVPGRGATLRSALTAVIRQQQVITLNPAKYVELDDSGKPPKAVVWTDEHVEAWRENRRERNLVALDLDAARERRDHSMIARLEAQLDKLDEQERPGLTPGSWTRGLCGRGQRN